MQKLIQVKKKNLWKKYEKQINSKWLFQEKKLNKATGQLPFKTGKGKIN